MKIKITFFLAATAAAMAHEGGATTAAGPAAAPAPCCVDEKTVTTKGDLSRRSIYQLGAEWTNDAGQRVTLASLRGRPVVLTLFFASCEYACPTLVKDMQRLREALPDDARAKTQFVLVSFDSVRDTPAALKAYRDRLALDGSWTLLHGEPATVQELAMLLGVRYQQDVRGQFSHSNLITVLNRDGEVAQQLSGLMGDITEMKRAVTLAAR
jgi:protein SCO1